MKNRKGYLPAATSPVGKNTNSRLNNVRDLKPPDLWIHHNEHVELKPMDKNNGSESPVMNRQHENSFAKIKKTNSTYGVNSSLYDDINKPATSPIDNAGMATMRRSSTIRVKPTCMEQAIANGIHNLEPSTGLSRPLYPKTQFNMPRSHLNLDSIDSSSMVFHSSAMHLYDPVALPPTHMTMGPGSMGQDNSLANIHIAMANSNNSYISGNSSSSPHSVVSNNTVLTNSSTATNITNSSTSPPNTCIYMSNKRPPGHALKSFGVPTPPPPLPSLASLNSQNYSSQNNIYNSMYWCVILLSRLMLIIFFLFILAAMSALGSPSKKFLLTTTNNLNSHMCGSNSTLASNGKSGTHFSDDHSISVCHTLPKLFVIFI